ncbi:MAG: LemA family protein [Phycisphaerales bacterium]
MLSTIAPSLLLGQALAGAAIVGLLFFGGAVVVALIAAVWGVGVYNNLQRLRIGAEGAFGDIDVQLRRRHDLIPNLVETVKGYAGHERQTLEAVISARARATGATSLPDRMAAEGELSQALGRLMVVTEAYPELKANQNFLQLQAELSSTENIIGNSRNGYNAAVGAYNEARVVFPSNLVAGIFGFQPLTFFELKDPAAREAPVVKF